MTERIYLDHAATTPLLPEAAEAMAPWLGPEFGNPSSIHREGRRARAALDTARETLADAVGCRFGEVVFTSGGTEAGNLAVLGAALGSEQPKRKRVLMSAAEHHCILHTRKPLERLGFTVETVPVDRYARARLGALEAMLGDDVLLVSVMHANNELGTLNDCPAIARLAASCGALYHADAVQSFPSATREQLGAKLMSVSSHKLHGPKGVGALFVRSGVPIDSVLVGGGQERELRAGTENVAGIVGFAAAVRAWRAHPEFAERRTVARDAFAQEAQRLLGNRLVVSVPPDVPTLGGHFHCRVPGVSAEALLIRLDRAGVAASGGAACSSGSLQPSHVMLACGYARDEAYEGLRFSFGKDNTPGQACEAAQRLAEAVDEVIRVASGR